MKHQKRHICDITTILFVSGSAFVASIKLATTKFTLTDDNHSERIRCNLGSQSVTEQPSNQYASSKTDMDFAAILSYILRRNKLRYWYCHMYIPNAANSEPGKCSPIQPDRNHRFCKLQTVQPAGKHAPSYES